MGLGGVGIKLADLSFVETRLASDPNDPFSWMLGGYYSHQLMDEIFDSDFAQSLGLATDTRYQQHVSTLAAFTGISL